PRHSRKPMLAVRAMSIKNFIYECLNSLSPVATISILFLFEKGNNSKNQRDYCCKSQYPSEEFCSLWSYVNHKRIKMIIYISLTLLLFQSNEEFYQMQVCLDRFFRQ